MPLCRFRTPAIINHKATTIIARSGKLTPESVMSSNVLTEPYFFKAALSCRYMRTESYRRRIGNETAHFDVI
jgi:hypothetical protein